MLGLDGNAALIEKALNGSVSAWERLVKRHERLIFNYTYRMTGNPDDAADLMQEVFLAVFRNLHQFKADGNFKSWLIRIATNRSIDFYRRRRPDQDGDDHAFEVLVDPGGNPDAELNRNENRRLVLSLLQRVSHEQRAVIELKFFQQFTFDEIADQLGVSPNTVKSRFYAALKHMKTHLEVTDVAC